MDLIKVLNKEELRNFKLFLRRIYLNNPNNLIAKLSDAYKSDNFIDDNVLHEQVFPEINKNSFYKLKNRLKEEVYKSLLILNYNKDDVNHILNLFLISRILTYKTQYKEALNLLKSANKKAAELEAFDLQVLIYNEIIHLSNHNININVPKIIAEKRIAEAKHRENVTINDFLAEYSWHLKKANFTGSEKSFFEQLIKIEKKIEKSEHLSKSANMQIQLQEITRNVLLQNKAFKKMSVYLEEKLKVFEQLQFFNKSNYSQKIKMLIWLINSYIYQSNFDQVIKNSNTLEEEIMKFNKMYYKNFYWSLLQSRTLAFYYSNQLNNAILLLQQAIENELVINNEFFNITVKINTSIVYFSLQNFDKGHAYLNFLQENTISEILDAQTIFKYQILDIIFYYERKEIEFLIHKIAEVKKQYKNVINQEKNSKYKKVIALLNKMSQSYPNSFSKKLKRSILEFIKDYEKEAITINEGINYQLWLQSKIENVTYYDLTLKNS